MRELQFFAELDEVRQRASVVIFNRVLPHRIIITNHENTTSQISENNHNNNEKTEKIWESAQEAKLVNVSVQLFGKTHVLLVLSIAKDVIKGPQSFSCCVNTGGLVDVSAAVSSVCDDHVRVQFPLITAGALPLSLLSVSPKDAEVDFCGRVSCRKCDADIINCVDIANFDENRKLFKVYSEASTLWTGGARDSGFCEECPQCQKTIKQ